MLGTSGPMQRPGRASLLPFGIQGFHRAEATAVFVGQVARVLRIADDHRRQQDDHLAAAGTRGLLAEQSADDGNPARPGKPLERRPTSSLIRPASITVSPLRTAAWVLSLR